MNALLHNEAVLLAAPGIVLGIVFFWKLPEILRETRLMVREWRKK